MKKVIFFIIICLISLSNAYSAQDDTPLSVTVDVRSIFRISVQTNYIDFGTLDPGSASPPRQVLISCETNDNVPWAVSLNVQSPFVYDQYEIPISNFKWEASTVNGSGQIISSGDMDLNPIEFYTSGLDEHITEEPVDLTVSLQIEIPRNQPAGQYSTVLYITMHPL